MSELGSNDAERQACLVTESVKVGIAHCDAECRYKFVNRHWAERRCLTPEQVIGKRIWEVVGEEGWSTLAHHVRECLAGNAIEFELELEFPYRPGELQFVHCCYEPEWRNGKVVGLIAAITNITSVKRAEAARRESEAMFRAMFDVSSVGHIEVDIESGRFLRANAAMCRLLGYTEAELLVRTIFDTTHPDDRYHAGELLRRMIAGESAASDVEKRCIRKDGSAVWVHVTANVVRDASGRPLRNIAVIQNIDARKEREEKVALLTRELNHRAKNILSVVQAIALQTADTNPEAFIERFLERVQALSANQDLLVKNEWNGVEIADLVHTQLAHFVDLIGSRITAQGPKLCLNPASAQTIGLAIHELSTNAGKYGALSTCKGRVDISWGMADDILTMSWTERGGPPVAAPEQRGFGSTVIEAMVEHNLRGAVDLDYAPSGLTWRVTCPAANALEPENMKKYVDGTFELDRCFATSG